MAKTSPSNESSAWLLHQWIVAGIVSSAARFIPVPFVDDVVRDQCRKFVIARTLAAHQQSELLSELKVYYSSDAGCLAGCIGMAGKVPLKLLLFPIRKIVAVFTSVREVPLEVIRTVLLGRTLDRMLREGTVPRSASDVNHMRIAFDETFSGMDFRVVKATMSDALRGVRGWKNAAVSLARRIASDRQATLDQANVDESVDTGASKLQRVLESADTLRLFEEFDRRFITTLSRRQA